MNAHSSLKNVMPAPEREEHDERDRRISERRSLEAR